MSNEIHQSLPTEVLVTDESLENQVKALRAGVESHAQKCADYTQYYFEKEGKDFTTFIAEVAKEPFNISIDAKSPTSIATGIFDLQHLLGMRLEPGYKTSCDGKFGPNTNRKFEKARDSYKLKVATAAKVQSLEKEIHPTTIASNPQVRPAEAVRPVIPTTNVVQPSVEVNNQLPETSISKTLFVGDSLTVGLENSHGIDGSLRPSKYDHKVWIDKKGKQRESWKGIAIGGQQTPAMFNALKHAEAQNELVNGERMVVWGGVNDIASARTPEQIIKTLTSIYSLAADHGMSIVACTITPWEPTEKTMKSLNERWMKNLRKPYPYTADQLKGHIKIVNSWIRTQAATTLRNTPGKNRNVQMQVVDLYTEVANNKKKYPQMSDNLHFVDKSPRAISDYITAQANIKRN